LHIGGRAFELQKLRKAEASLDAGIEEAFRAAMPGQQNATNARRRVAQRLDEVRNGGGGTLLPALVAIATARTAAPATTIEGITFREGVVSMRVIAPDAAALDAMSQQLRATNWQADIKDLNASGESYRGRVEIKKAGA
jgi:type II secretory pathway component PulL